MALWKALLRVIGVLLLIGLAGEMFQFFQTDGLHGAYAYSILVGYVERFAIGLICFASAAALSQLNRIEQRITRASSGRRREAQSPAYTPSDAYPLQSRPTPDLAPVAPDWEELKLGIHPEVIERRLKRSHRSGSDDPGGLYENAIAHGIRVGAPMVREAPPPSRVTPGTEDQYIDAPPLARPTAPYRRSGMIPHKGGVDRELLRQGRDQQIRRSQSGQ